jgi:AcrR family transcriptional regulator
VLGATVEILAGEGYEHLSVESVAARAGVHKTTVYRRWPTKADLVADAVRERAQQLVPVPDTGTLAGDLRALARSIAGNIGSDVGTRMARTLIAAAVVSDEIAATQREFWAERFALTGVIVERAIARDELPPRTDARFVLETLIGPLYVRLLLTGEPIDAEFADRAAASAAAGALTP